MNIVFEVKLHDILTFKWMNSYGWCNSLLQLGTCATALCIHPKVINILPGEFRLFFPLYFPSYPSKFYHLKTPDSSTSSPRCSTVQSVYSCEVTELLEGLVHSKVALRCYLANWFIIGFSFTTDYISEHYLICCDQRTRNIFNGCIKKWYRCADCQEAPSSALLHCPNYF